jgi:hypothetical protein
MAISHLEFANKRLDATCNESEPIRYPLLELPLHCLVLPRNVGTAPVGHVAGLEFFSEHFDFTMYNSSYVVRNNPGDGGTQTK